MALLDELRMLPFRLDLLGPGVGSVVGGAGVAGGGTTTNESQGLMSVDSSFRRALMGLPLGSIRTLNSDQYSMDNTSMSTGAQSFHRHALSKQFSGSRSRSCGCSE